MNDVKLLHIKCCFFQFFNSPLALKNKKNLLPPPQEKVEMTPLVYSNEYIPIRYGTEQRYYRCSIFVIEGKIGMHLVAFGLIVIKDWSLLSLVIAVQRPTSRFYFNFFFIFKILLTMSVYIYHTGIHQLSHHGMIGIYTIHDLDRQVETTNLLRH